MQRQNAVVDASFWINAERSQLVAYLPEYFALWVPPLVVEELATATRLADWLQRGEARLLTPEGRFGRFDGKKVFVELCMAQVAEVEVDPETGQVKVLHVSAACDSGTIINPPAAEGQVEGAFVQGVGLAMMEEMVIDEEGRVANPNFGEYKIPTTADLPAFTLTWIEDAPGPLPFGGRALAEHGHIPTSPAIANAIRDVAGIRLKHIPFRPETVYEALLAKERA